ncbi:uncharacterized protein LOC144159305 [Haemaphysalis longicornis]
MANAPTSTPVPVPQPAAPATQQADATGTAATDVEPQEAENADINDVPQHIEVNPRYITTAQGMLTCMEVFGAVAVMVLYLLISNTITYQWYAHVAFMLAFTYGLNNVLIILSGVASPSTQLHLPETLFYSLYHCLAGFFYVVGGAIFHNVHKDDELRYRGSTGVGSFRAPSTLLFVKVWV